ncbi:MAG: hypothetical protein EOO24_18795 [Comamonadaceae bacterium]|nr:MAG: hypothetical protein EOO24_18795 [Comamonadaceae bacterium]
MKTGSFLADGFAFAYRGCRMLCSAEATGPTSYRPVVVYRSGLPGMDEMALAHDEPLASTPSEAIRRGQQHAMRWVNERTPGWNWSF